MSSHEIENTESIRDRSDAIITAYRVYTLAQDDKIIGAEVLDAGTDAQAIKIVNLMKSAFVLELWERGRLIGRFNPGLACA